MVGNALVHPRSSKRAKRKEISSSCITLDFYKNSRGEKAKLVEGQTSGWRRIGAVKKI